MKRIHGRAEDALLAMVPGSFDLVVTSPPAYPSPRQAPGLIGREGSLSQYVASLGRVVRLCRRVLRPDGFLVLVIEPLPGQNPLGLLSIHLKRMSWVILASYQWVAGAGRASAVIFLTPGAGHLNRGARAWDSGTWLIPGPAPDAEYGFYEWPPELVQAIVDLTIPAGGSVLDPMAGKASALEALDPRWVVTAVDVLP